MSKRGTRPKPTFLRVIGGNAAKRPINHDEPKPQGNLKEAPPWLTASQAEGWDYAIEHAPPGLLKKLDRSILAVWVVAEDTYRQAVEMVNRHGLLIKAPNTGVPVQSPYLSIQNKQASLMIKACAELGFTPSSRTGIQVDPGKSNAFSNNGRRFPAA